MITNMISKQQEKWINKITSLNIMTLTLFYRTNIIRQMTTSMSGRLKIVCITFKTLYSNAAHPLRCEGGHIISLRREVTVHKTILILPPFYWSAFTKSGNWVVIYIFHNFPVVDWFCLLIYLWVLTFPL